jgi:hypothetical protein
MPRPDPIGARPEVPDDRFTFVFDDTAEPGNLLPALAELLIDLAKVADQGPSGPLPHPSKPEPSRRGSRKREVKPRGQ